MTSLSPPKVSQKCTLGLPRAGASSSSSMTLGPLPFTLAWMAVSINAALHERRAFAELSAPHA